MNLEDVRKEARTMCDAEEENDFRAVVNFFHDRHVFLHFDEVPELDRLVLLDAQWLIDVFKQVITVKPYECHKKEFEKHWKTLEREGVLRKELVQHVWKDFITDKETIDSLLSIMEKFGLVCRWTRPDGSEVCNDGVLALAICGPLYLLISYRTQLRLELPVVTLHNILVRDGKIWRAYDLLVSVFILFLILLCKTLSFYLEENYRTS